MSAVKIGDCDPAGCAAAAASLAVGSSPLFCLPERVPLLPLPEVAGCCTVVSRKPFMTGTNTCNATAAAAAARC
jgi:hypothetical protein